MDKKLFKYLTFIPARSGSVGLKNKNLKKIGKKNLIEIAIEFSKKFNDKNNFIFVSTDSEEYAKISIKAGANVPFLRSKKYSKSNSLMQDAINEFLIKIKDLENYTFEYLVIILPTQPFRKIEDLKNGMKLFQKKVNTVISVKNIDRPKELIFHKKNNEVKIKAKHIPSNRQFIKSNYTPCGCFIVTKIKSYIKSNLFYNKKIMAINTEFPFNHDIDSKLDLKLAKLIHKGL